jgi:phenylalanyl-tRNA synthetase beta chain
MNIKITHNWLLEYLNTDASPYEIQKYLSLCGPSVDRVEKIGNDYVYDIEITSNRIDTASVFGIAQECQAILPMFGKKARIKQNPLEKYKFLKLGVETCHGMSLQIKIINPNLCHRFTAVILDNIEIKSSPEFIKQRLNACGIKSINNVIDISNYLMVALGQPTHVFDYDVIGREQACLFPTMIMREAKKGEKIITLDEKAIFLPGGDIVIEDGAGKLIDLCGIMGGLNSSVRTGQCPVLTKRIVLFVQTYNKQKIRQTSMITGQRTVAATYFEKGLDEERVKPTLVYGIELLQKYAKAKVSSQLYDIYPNPYKKKLLVISYELLEKIIGIKIKEEKIDEILQDLGFQLYHLDHDRKKMVKVKVPSWRNNDISIPEDVIEEVARIYGYHNLPNNLPPPAYIKQPKEIEDLFVFQQKVKYFLKHLSYHELCSYSMISEKDIENMGFNPQNYGLKIKNPISDELVYLRTTLIPSMIKTLKFNEGKRDHLTLFEIAKTYLKTDDNNLPREVTNLIIGNNLGFFELKGVLEALFNELNIDELEFDHGRTFFFSKKEQSWIMNRETKKNIGIIGRINSQVKNDFSLDNDVWLAEIDFEELIKIARLIAKFTSINPFAVIKLDLTINLSGKLNFAIIKKLSLKTSQLLQKIEVVDIFRNKITLRFFFSSPKRNITEEDAKGELEKIKNVLID